MAAKKSLDSFREREDREEREFQDALEEKLLKSRLESKGKPSGLSHADAQDALLAQGGGPSEKVAELLDRVEPLIEQVHVLFTQYFTGVERLPPVARRTQLDQVMQALTQMPKTSQTMQYRFRSAQSRYLSYSEQWDRKLRDLESGKVARKPIRG